MIPVGQVRFKPNSILVPRDAEKVLLSYGTRLPSVYRETIEPEGRHFYLQSERALSLLRAADSDSQVAASGFGNRVELLSIIDP